MEVLISATSSKKRSLTAQKGLIWAISTKPSELMVNLEYWLNNPGLREALNVIINATTKIQAKNIDVFNKMKPDIMRVIWKNIPPVLESQVPMLWDQGQLDWVDGVYSNQAWINALEWKDAAKYAKSERQSW